MVAELGIKYFLLRARIAENRFDVSMAFLFGPFEGSGPA